MLAYLVCLPLHHLTLTSGYGIRVHPITRQWAFHSGIDLRARSDTVFAIMNGIVVKASYDNFLGIYIQLDHSGLQSLYGHLSQIFVLPGDTVLSDQPIGVTGCSGRTTGEHLHFGILYNSKPVNPLQFLYRLIIFKSIKS